jgi:hypothetical protein
VAVAIWQDVATALGRSTSAFPAEQQNQITYWLNGIELLIRNRLGAVDALDQDLLAYVETEAVAEKVRNAGEDGAESVTVSVDDGSVTRRFKRGVAASDITDDWWELLAPAETSGAFTINPMAGRKPFCS